jgi:hypothetical protein
MAISQRQAHKLTGPPSGGSNYFKLSHQDYIKSGPLLSPLKGTFGLHDSQYKPDQQIHIVCWEFVSLSNASTEQDLMTFRTYYIIELFCPQWRLRFNYILISCVPEVVSTIIKSSHCWLLHWCAEGFWKRHVTFSCTSLSHQYINLQHVILETKPDFTRP